MKKRGFTLVELLAVLVVLAVISTIAFPIVNNIIDESEEKAYKQQIKTIEKAAKNWSTDNSNLLVEIDDNDEIVNKSCYITLDRIKYEGYLETNDTINPIDDSNMNNYVVELNYDSNSHQYLYNVVPKSDVSVGACDSVNIAINDGTAVYFNPETKSKCSSTEATVATGTKTGCMKWYTFGGDNNSSTVNLILAHNTTAKVAYNSTGDNNAPLEAAKQLSSDTATWDSSLKPRFITADEVATITGNKTFNPNTDRDESWFYFDTNTDESTGEGKYYWLFDYMDCEGSGCKNTDSNVFGYWTSSSALNNDPTDPCVYVWAVNYDGSLDVSDIQNSGGDGIRPVITVEKSIIYNY